MDVLFWSRCLGKLSLYTMAESVSTVTVQIASESVMWKLFDTDGVLCENIVTFGKRTWRSC